MTNGHEGYWDELGLAWSASLTETDMIAPRLGTRLRRQSAWIMVGLFAALPASLAGMALALFTAWMGWTTGSWHFVTRGVAIALISLLLLRAALSMASVRNSEDARALSAMLDLSICRARRTLLAVRLGIYAAFIAGLFGLLGTVIRTSTERAPQLSPVIDCFVLLGVVIGLFLYRRRVQDRLARLCAVSRALEGNNGG